jgi:hypothetical protein
VADSKLDNIERKTPPENKKNLSPIYYLCHKDALWPWAHKGRGGDLERNLPGADRCGCSFSDQMPKFFISFDEVDQLGV